MKYLLMTSKKGGDVRILIIERKKKNEGKEDGGHKGPRDCGEV